MTAIKNSLYLENLIFQIVRKMVNDANTMTQYRKPVISFSKVNKEDFFHLKRVVNPKHRLPEDLLPSAVTIVSFFIPFSEDVVNANRFCSSTAEEWAIAYSETNRLIEQISNELVIKLGEKGVCAAWEPPTHNFDKITLTAVWSHKSMAKITGLGSYGLHQMIITDAGCAGRLGSLVIDATVEQKPKRETERCFHYINGSCSMCVESCPVGALTEEGLNKKKCWMHILEIDKSFSYLSDKKNLTGPFDVCGKCVTGPCAVI